MYILLIVGMLKPDLQRLIKYQKLLMLQNKLGPWSGHDFWV